LQRQRGERPGKSGRFATCSPRKSFARMAISFALSAAGIAWTAGELSDRIIISIPLSSSGRSRFILNVEGGVC